MLSRKQNEYIREATHRINMKVGAVRSGKSYVDVTYMIPRRIREVSGKEGLNVILGVSRETIERNVLQPMREQYTDLLVGTINSLLGGVAGLVIALIFLYLAIFIITTAAPVVKPLARINTAMEQSMIVSWMIQHNLGLDLLLDLFR